MLIHVDVLDMALCIADINFRPSVSQYISLLSLLCLDNDDLVVIWNCAFGFTVNMVNAICADKLKYIYPTTMYPCQVEEMF